MADWYYALGNQQKGPVSLDALKQLAASGKLQRTDMVWREGMVEWKKAGQVDGIFTRAEVQRAEVQRAEVQRSEVQRDEAEPLRRRPQREIEEEEADETEDDRPRRKKKRRRERSPGQMAAIIGGSVGGGILILILVIILVARLGRTPANDGKPAALQGGNTYTLTLKPGQDDMRTFNFLQGKKVEVLVRTPQGILRNPDVDLYITRAGDQAFELIDDAISENCYLQFVAPASDQYMIEVHNLGPGSATCTVTIRES
ncbi:MAG: DUF4339 domain-containing protein [Gemmataceae bacterium]|nr:DUF4339 domain-containing protein [Gemmataceae bacterium]